MTSIRILSTLAVMGAMPDLTAMYEAQTGTRIDTDFAPTVALLERLRANQPADIAILTAQAIDDLIQQGVMRPGTRTDMALSFVGIAIKTGAPKPDIHSVAALKTTLLAARSVAYSKIGASGIFFASLIERLGIAAEVNARAVIVPSGFTAERHRPAPLPGLTRHRSRAATRRAGASRFMTR
jgi:molybdate transport system substrate-binding protein